MLELVRTTFHKFFSILLWANLIICTLSGMISGFMNGFGFGILGLIGGFLVGAISTVVFGGLLATVLNMDKNLQEIRDHFINEGGSK